MWIKIILCSADEDYCDRLARYLDKKYGDNLEVTFFHNFEKAMLCARNQNVDILLFEEEFESDLQSVEAQKYGTVGILTSERYADSGEGYRKIAKFQKGEKLYQDILDLYASGEKVKQGHYGTTRENGNLIAFLSACGGVGVSTVSRAFAKKSALYEKTLFIDLGMYAAAYMQEQGGLSDILIALQSKRNILPYKLASVVHQTKDRFYTYAPCENAADLLELSAEKMNQLIEEIVKMDEYNTVIFDLGTRLSGVEIEILKQADKIVYVYEESNCSKEKLQKFIEVLKKIEEKETAHLHRKLYLFRNKQKQHSVEKNVMSEYMSPGGSAPYISMEDYEEVIDRISQSGDFDDLETENAG